MGTKASFKRKQVLLELKGKKNPFGKNSKINPDIAFLKQLGINASEKNASEIVSKLQQLVKDKKINIELAVKRWKENKI